jgi:hypothetical protein
MQQRSQWQRHLLSRKESIKTREKFQLAMLVLVLLILLYYARVLDAEDRLEPHVYGGD